MPSLAPHCNHCKHYLCLHALTCTSLYPLQALSLSACPHLHLTVPTANTVSVCMPSLAPHCNHCKHCLCLHVLTCTSLYPLQALSLSACPHLHLAVPTANLAAPDRNFQSIKTKIEHVKDNITKTIHGINHICD